MKKHIPNAITCLNLLSGCIGIVLAFNTSLATTTRMDNLVYAGYAIIIAAVLDFFDGLLARLLHAYSEIGKELDSLADMVSFGVLPAVIVYHLFLEADQIAGLSTYLNYAAFLIAIFSALRLAKFNIDTRQSDNFIGLPTPANAMLIASLPLIISDASSFWRAYLLNPFFLFIFSLGMSLLLVMEVPLISLKFRNLDIKENLLRYILLLSSAVLILIFKFAAVPIIIFIYIVLSIAQFRLIR
ncbi:CDP-diacylglycerol--serine O-phosphatidyltransferase [Pedobacter sp. SYSU D00535]|uniref:CDP-diacylglycerol--serine O-phosphatidyltransferase n=1 Tax=Pedobacter sp. SYSU D00535 TaxID=2810308 RepID=UPI001A96BC3A|nr:CDP-diacylglycerol--serine O-phosphatidyltransferase [Pedobacter sp. SYSU D00535]